MKYQIHVYRVKSKRLIEVEANGPEEARAQALQIAASRKIGAHDFHRSDCRFIAILPTIIHEDYHKPDHA